MAELAIPLAVGTQIGGGLLAAEGREAAGETQVRSAREQAEIEALLREFQERQFGKQIERQAPFVAAGEAALPDLVSAISNRPTTETLPAERIQAEQIMEFLGPQAPSFVTEEALGDLSAIEAERNKARLSDLVNIGLGGVGSGASSRLNLGAGVGGTIARTGDITAQSLQQQAINRQNLQNELFAGLTGLPALVASAGGGPQGFNIGSAFF